MATISGEAATPERTRRCKQHNPGYAELVRAAALVATPAVIALLLATLVRGWVTDAFFWLAWSTSLSVGAYQAAMRASSSLAASKATGAKGSAVAIYLLDGDPYIGQTVRPAQRLSEHVGPVGNHPDATGMRIIRWCWTASAANRIEMRRFRCFADVLSNEAGMGDRGPTQRQADRLWRRIYTLEGVLWPHCRVHVPKTARVPGIDPGWIDVFGRIRRWG